MALNITKGEATAVPSQSAASTKWIIEIKEPHMGGSERHAALVYGIYPMEAEHNAQLIADAFNTSNKTGLLPSELAEQRDELARILLNAVMVIEAKDPDGIIVDTKSTKELLALITKTTLTRSEADEAMSNGYHVAHNDYQASAYLFKKNGVVCGDDGIPYLGKPTILHVVAPSDNFKTGWRIVHP